MNRASLEHVLRAAASASGERDFVVIGSQAVLGQFPDAPSDLLVSLDVDLYPRHAPEKSDLVEGAIGELSEFHTAFGYYAHGVDETTATLPVEWESRLVPVRNDNTGGATGWCLEIHDLAVSKLVAGRERDISYLAVLLREHLVDAPVLRQRLEELSLEPARIAGLQQRLERLIRESRASNR
jgi:hypothetical protein